MKNINTMIASTANSGLGNLRGWVSSCKSIVCETANTLKTKAKRAFALLLMLCAFAQGAWAQNTLEEFIALIGNSPVDLTYLSESSTTGRTIGTEGRTSFYVASANLTFSNTTARGSGLTIQGTVYLYVPEGITITCTGADADGWMGAGAGIELAEGNTLYLLGCGTVNATGGNAANGGEGTDGTDAYWGSAMYRSGSGGDGGDGGGGAGAGIGTCGGDGGGGGAGAAFVHSEWSKNSGGSGSNGEAGATAGAMGALCVSTSFHSLTATGGSAASASGIAGSAGKSCLYDGTYNYGAAGGGGGGGGGFGGAASNIGTGGPGGGGGGGGASGNLDYASTGYWVVKAPGGKGGQNVDGTWAAAGAESILNYNAINSGQVISNSAGWGNYDSWVSTQPVGTGGNGGAKGNASTSESAINIDPSIKQPTQEEWNAVCSQTNTNQSQWTAIPFVTSMEATLGTAGTTTYYYTTGDRTFVNANAGGSGLTIQGTVYLFIASGQTITCKGANADGQTGAGAGIELAEGNALYLLGCGTVNATGGNAANGGEGTDGTNAYWDSAMYRSGSGGDGGDGGGGAGAGIGTCGGDGGGGGRGAAFVHSDWSTNFGGSGSNGEAGATAGAMGALCVSTSFHSLTATGGSAASTSGSAGSAGKSVLYDGTYNYGAAGGGGGGGGGFGGVASNIGTGGPGGGGGGGGASGNLDYASTGYYVVKAPGGKGGQNVDGTWAAAGAESILNYNAINSGQVISNSAGWGNYDSYVSTQAVGTGGNGGAKGGATNNVIATDADGNYLLYSTTDWDTFAALASNGINNFSGKTVKLMADISVSTMVGNSESNSFQGTFLGNGQTLTFTKGTDAEPFGEEYCAPFRYVNGAAIQDLKVAGGIYTSRKFAGGLVARSYGTTTVTNCQVATVIRSSVNGDGTHGGIVVFPSGILYITGCVYNGRLLTNNGTNACGGFVGWYYDNQATISVSNSLYAPGSIPEGWTPLNDYATFVRGGGSNLTITGCYYTETMGMAQGAQAYSITSGSGVTIENDGTVSNVYNVSGLIFFTTGFKYGDAHYAANGDAVSLNVAAPAGYVIGTVTYTPEGGTATVITPVDGIYSFTMPEANVVINATLTPDCTLDIAGYGDTDAGYVLIASPVGTVSPADVTNMLENSYDLYRFNQASDKEWENYKATDPDTQEPLNPDFTTLEPGKGYLYANSGTVTLTFPGTPYSGTGDVTLNKTDGANFEGWNLVGNPFAAATTITKPFYRMNPEGSEIITNEGSSSIAPMEGIFVVADTDGETLTFSQATRATNDGERIVVDLSHPSTSSGTGSTSVIDRAIVRFGEGHTLPKFQLNPSHTKVYIPQDGKDYAIASVIARRHDEAIQTEIPVNFKAEENGTYTLSFSLENMDLDYLHLIDNMTGADVDLLTPAGFPFYKGGQGDSNNPQTVSYTFTAKTTDYASRFRLVFSVCEDANDDNEAFAYINNGDIIINEADAHGASLQVVDMTGRVVVSVGGRTRCVPTSGMMPGVYVLRLINGDDVKTQKIVVK